MEKRVLVADFSFSVTGEPFESFIEKVGAFDGFSSDREPDFRIVPELDAADFAAGGKFHTMAAVYEVSFENVDCAFCKFGDYAVFRMVDTVHSSSLFLLWKPGDAVVRYTPGKYSPTVSRFALWMAFNMLTISHKCAAIHSSVNVCNGGAVMFLGESGTGKSTHTRLLRENYPEMFLLNDDSPFVRISDDGGVMVYGSPWSGKTPCYKQMSFPLKAIVRLSQAPYNRITRLSTIAAIGALLPSAPPAFNYIESTSDLSCGIVSDVVSATPFYYLACLPDKAAAELSYNTVFCNGR